MSCLTHVISSCSFILFTAFYDTYSASEDEDESWDWDEDEDEEYWDM